MIHRAHKGFSMIEVLVTIVILLIGLLGLAGLQSRALTSQMESYQRVQGLVLAEDMAARINDNRINAASYVTSTPLGTGYGSCTATGTGVAADLCDWNSMLLGAAEVNNSSSQNVGAMIGARGCVYQLVAAASGVPAQYMVAVAWQGLNATQAPAVNCGQGSYGNDALRRVITLPLSIGILL